MQRKLQEAEERIAALEQQVADEKARHRKLDHKLKAALQREQATIARCNEQVEEERQKRMKAQAEVQVAVTMTRTECEQLLRKKQAEWEQKSLKRRLKEVEAAREEESAKWSGLRDRHRRMLSSRRGSGSHADSSEMESVLSAVREEMMAAESSREPSSKVTSSSKLTDTDGFDETKQQRLQVPKHSSSTPRLPSPRNATLPASISSAGLESVVRYLQSENVRLIQENETYQQKITQLNEQLQEEYELIHSLQARAKRLEKFESARNSYRILLKYASISTWLQKTRMRKSMYTVLACLRTLITGYVQERQEELRVGDTEIKDAGVWSREEPEAETYLQDVEDIYMRELGRQWRKSIHTLGDPEANRSLAAHIRSESKSYVRPFAQHHLPVEGTRSAESRHFSLYGSNRRSESSVEFNMPTSLSDSSGTLYPNEEGQDVLPTSSARTTGGSKSDDIHPDGTKAPPPLKLGSLSDRDREMVALLAKAETGSSGRTVDSNPRGTQGSEAGSPFLVATSLSTVQTPPAGTRALSMGPSGPRSPSFLRMALNPEKSDVMSPTTTKKFQKGVFIDAEKFLGRSWTEGKPKLTQLVTRVTDGIQVLVQILSLRRIRERQVKLMIEASDKRALEVVQEKMELQRELKQRRRDFALLAHILVAFRNYATRKFGVLSLAHAVPARLGHLVNRMWTRVTREVSPQSPLLQFSPHPPTAESKRRASGKQGTGASSKRSPVIGRSRRRGRDQPRCTRCRRASSQDSEAVSGFGDFFDWMTQFSPEGCIEMFQDKYPRIWAHFSDILDPKVIASVYGQPKENEIGAQPDDADAQSPARKKFGSRPTRKTANDTAAQAAVTSALTNTDGNVVPLELLRYFSELEVKMAAQGQELRAVKGSAKDVTTRGRMLFHQYRDLQIKSCTLEAQLRKIEAEKRKVAQRNEDLLVHLHRITKSMENSDQVMLSAQDRRTRTSVSASMHKEHLQAVLGMSGGGLRSPASNPVRAQEGPSKAASDVALPRTVVKSVPKFGSLNGSPSSQRGKSRDSSEPSTALSSSKNRTSSSDAGLSPSFSKRNSSGELSHGAMGSTPSAKKDSSLASSIPLSVAIAQNTAERAADEPQGTPCLLDLMDQEDYMANDSVGRADTTTEVHTGRKTDASSPPTAAGQGGRRSAGEGNIDNDDLAFSGHVSVVTTARERCDSSSYGDASTGASFDEPGIHSRHSLKSGSTDADVEGTPWSKPGFSSVSGSRISTSVHPLMDEPERNSADFMQELNPIDGVDVSTPKGRPHSTLVNHSSGSLRMRHSISALGSKRRNPSWPEQVQGRSITEALSAKPAVQAGLQRGSVSESLVPSTPTGTSAAQSSVAHSADENTGLHIPVSLLSADADDISAFDKSCLSGEGTLGSTIDMGSMVKRKERFSSEDTTSTSDLQRSLSKDDAIGDGNAPLSAIVADASKTIPKSVPMESRRLRRSLVSKSESEDSVLAKTSENGEQESHDHPSETTNGGDKKEADEDNGIDANETVSEEIDAHNGDEGGDENSAVVGKVDAVSGESNVSTAVNLQNDNANVLLDETGAVPDIEISDSEGRLSRNTAGYFSELLLSDKTNSEESKTSVVGDLTIRINSTTQRKSRGHESMSQEAIKALALNLGSNHGDRTRAATLGHTVSTNDADEIKAIALDDDENGGSLSFRDSQVSKSTRVEQQGKQGSDELGQSRSSTQESPTKNSSAEQDSTTADVVTDSERTQEDSSTGGVVTDSTSTHKDVGDSSEKSDKVSSVANYETGASLLDEMERERRLNSMFRPSPVQKGRSRRASTLQLLAKPESELSESDRKLKELLKGMKGSYRPSKVMESREDGSTNPMMDGTTSDRDAQVSKAIEVKEYQATNSASETVLSDMHSVGTIGSIGDSREHWSTRAVPSAEASSDEGDSSNAAEHVLESTSHAVSEGNPVVLRGSVHSEPPSDRDETPAASVAVDEDQVKEFCQRANVAFFRSYEDYLRAPLHSLPASTPKHVQGKGGADAEREQVSVISLKEKDAMFPAASVFSDISSTDGISNESVALPLAHFLGSPQTSLGVHSYYAGAAPSVRGKAGAAEEEQKTSENAASEPSTDQKPPSAAVENRGLAASRAGAVNGLYQWLQQLTDYYATNGEVPAPPPELTRPVTQAARGPNKREDVGGIPVKRTQSFPAKHASLDQSVEQHSHPAHPLPRIEVVRGGTSSQSSASARAKEDRSHVVRHMPPSKSQVGSSKSSKDSPDGRPARWKSPMYPAYGDNMWRTRVKRSTRSSLPRSVLQKINKSDRPMSSGDPPVPNDSAGSATPSPHRLMTSTGNAGSSRVLAQHRSFSQYPAAQADDDSEVSAETLAGLPDQPSDDSVAPINNAMSPAVNQQAGEVPSEAVGDAETSSMDSHGSYVSGEWRAYNKSYVSVSATDRSVGPPFIPDEEQIGPSNPINHMLSPASRSQQAPMTPISRTALSSMNSRGSFYNSDREFSMNSAEGSTMSRSVGGMGGRDFASPYPTTWAEYSVSHQNRMLRSPQRTRMFSNEPHLSPPPRSSGRRTAGAWTRTGTRTSPYRRVDGGSRQTPVGRSPSYGRRSTKRPTYTNY